MCEIERCKERRLIRLNNNGLNKGEVIPIGFGRIQFFWNSCLFQEIFWAFLGVFGGFWGMIIFYRFIR